MTTTPNPVASAPMHPIVGRIINHRSTKKCLCGKPIHWKRWRMYLCDDCAENLNLRNFAFSRLVFEAESTPPEVRNVHESMMVHHATMYFDACPPNAKDDGSRSDPVQRPVEPAAQSGEKDNSK